MTFLVKPVTKTANTRQDFAERFEEMFQSYVESGFTGSSGGGLTLNVATGKAYVRGFRVESDAVIPKTLTDASTNHVYLQLDDYPPSTSSKASVSTNTTGVAPSNSIKLMEVVTAGGAISTITDKRPLTPVDSADVGISGSGSALTKLSDWRDANDSARIDFGDVYTPIDEDVYQKKATPALRQKGTETSAKDWRLAEDTGKIKFQENTGTEGSPVWTDRLVWDVATGSLETIGSITGLNDTLRAKANSDLYLKNNTGTAIVARINHGETVFKTRDLIPDGDNAFDLGDVTSRWRHVRMLGVLYYGAAQQKILLSMITLGRHNAAWTAGATQYLGPAGILASETVDAFTIITRAGKLQVFRVRLQTAPGVGQSITFTIRVNAVDTLLVVTISETATTGQDVSNDADLAIGDRVSVKVVSSAGAAAQGASASVELV